MHKGLKSVAAVLAVSAALAGCDRTPATIKIGVGQPLSGPLADQGHDLLNGAQLAVDEINAAGGVHLGSRQVPLEIVSGDDQANADAGKAVAAKLVEAGVEVAIADLNSGVSIAAAPTYADAHIPQLAISTNPKYTQLGLPTTLRLVANDDLQSKALGSFAAQLPGATHYSVVDDATPYGKGLADGAEKIMRAQDRHIDLRSSLDDKTTSFEALVADMKAQHIDVLVTTLSAFQVEALLPQLKAAGLEKLVIVGGDTLKTDRLAKLPAQPGAIYATSPIAEPREFAGGKDFLQRFRGRFKSDPVYGAHYAYDAVYLVVDALSRNASVDKEQLLRTLKTFDGNCPITDSMRFGADGEQRYGAVSVYQLRPGAWDPLMRSDRW